MQALARLMAPLARDESGWLLVSVVSLAGGVLLVLALGLLSRRTAVVAARRRMVGCLLEMSLYGSDARVTLCAFGASLVANGKYLLLLLPAAIGSILLVAPLYLLLDGYLGHRLPLRGGESVVVEVMTPSGGAIGHAVASGGYAIDAGPIGGPDHSVVWRFKRIADAAGRLTVRVAGEELSVPLPGRVGHLVPLQVRHTYRLGDSRKVRVSVGWPVAHMLLGNWELPWQLPFLVLLSIVAAALMKRFHVSV